MVPCPTTVSNLSSVSVARQDRRDVQATAVRANIEPKCGADAPRNAENEDRSDHRLAPEPNLVPSGFLEIMSWKDFRAAPFSQALRVHWPCPPLGADKMPQLQSVSQST